MTYFEIPKEASTFMKMMTMSRHKCETINEGFFKVVGLWVYHKGFSEHVKVFNKPRFDLFLKVHKYPSQ